MIDVQELLIGRDAAVGTREVIALEDLEPEFRADAHVSSPGARVGLNGLIVQDDAVFGNLRQPKF